WRGTRRAVAALLLGGGAGALALALLLPAASDLGAARARAATSAPRVAPHGARPPSPDEAEVTVSCHGALSDPLDADGARLRAAVAELDRPDASVLELQDLGSLLTRLL